MNILVNALPLRHGGGVTYLEQQLAAFSRVMPAWCFHTLVSSWSQLDNAPGSFESRHFRSVPQRFAYEQFQLPFRRADLLYCPANFGPLAFRGPMVLTLHNANYYGSGLQLAETRTQRPARKVRANHIAMVRADAVVAISQSLADQVVETLPGISNKLHVIHSGAPEWPPESLPVEGLPERYILVVASGAPHKRIGDVVAGWSGALDAAPDAPALVVLGKVGADQIANFRAIAEAYAKMLIFVGQVESRSQMKWLYENAIVAVSMSALEAFPLTPAEAGSVGCPLILSDIPSHREVANDNAVYVPVGDVESLSNALREQIKVDRHGHDRWAWPVTWDDNAREFKRLFERFAR